MNTFTKADSEGNSQDAAICFAIWPPLAEEPFAPEQYTSMAIYAKGEIEGARQALQQTRSGMDENEKLKTIMNLVRSSTHNSLEEVTKKLNLDLLNSGNQDDRQHLQAILRFSTCLNTMTRIRINLTVTTPEEPCATWHLQESLQITMAKVFSNPPAPSPRDRKIHRELTMSNLASRHKCGMLWTNHLDQHLDCHDDGEMKVVYIFQHKIWLSSHVNWSEQCALPQNIICEALDTLNLLFPHDNRQTKSFLEKRGQKFYSLGYCGRERKLNLSDYPHWGDKLEKLLNIFEGKRSGIWQFLPRPDRPNLLESANFWIATAAAVLAFVGFILGLMSIVYAKWSYDIGKESLIVSRDSLELTRLQYELSLAQACSDAEEARLLPDFCSAEE